MIKLLFRCPVVCVAVLAGLAVSPAARADSITNFQTPSGNIHCALIEGDEGGMVDCEMLAIDSFTLPLKRPADCELDWGQRFELTEDQGPAMSCYGDTVRDPNSPVLRYGKSKSAANITCTSEKSGLTCIDGAGHGFTLSRASQRFF